MDRIFQGKRETAATLGISVRTLENLIARKELETRRIGRRRLIPRVALERLARRDVLPIPEPEAPEADTDASQS